MGKSAKPETANAEPVEKQVAKALDWLKKHGTKAGRDGMARYAIPSDKAFGVSMKEIQSLARQIGLNHNVAAELWKSGWYEARMLAAYVDEPDQITAAQMDRWCKDFDNWAICDTICFALFDRTPHAWEKVGQWSAKQDEFVKRAAFALLWGLTVHDKKAVNEPFLHALTLVEREAQDERNFVKKAINMALRAIGKRNKALNAAAQKSAQRLADSTNAAARWVGKDALKELTSPAVARRLAGNGTAKKRSS